MVSGPMPAPYYKAKNSSREYTESLLCNLTNWGIQIKELRWEPRVAADIVGYRIIPGNTFEERFRRSHCILFWIVFKIY